MAPILLRFCAGALKNFLILDKRAPSVLTLASAHAKQRFPGAVRFVGNASAVTRIYDLGPFQLDVASRTLSNAGAPVPLGLHAVAVLTNLVERAPRLVPKSSIMDAVWPNVVVEESNLAVQIHSLRRALAQVPGGDRWIETLPRRGYRFVGPVAARPDPDERGSNRSNLPEPTTSFVGRERDRAEIRRLVPTKHLVMVVGAGGIGKTRLVMQVASEVIGAYRDGVWFVDLSALRDPTLVPRSVAQVLGVPERAGKSLRLPIAGRRGSNVADWTT